VVLARGFVALVRRAGDFLLTAFLAGVFLRDVFFGTGFFLLAAFFFEAFFEVLFALPTAFLPGDFVLLGFFLLEAFLRDVAERRDTFLVAAFFVDTFFFVTFFFDTLRLLEEAADFEVRLDALAARRFLLGRATDLVAFLPPFFLVFLAAAFFVGISKASKTYQTKQAIIHTP